jgi:predicted ATPase/transcriptional regulator with XRE-family HTH domain
MQRAGFGDLLRAHRSRARLTQDELAERAGLSVDAIGLLERGERRRPQRHTIGRLADALALSDADREELVAASRRAAGPRWTLPQPGTPFVGRAVELAGAGDLLLAPDVRLVTLLGPGGVGKTRLALAVANRLAARMPDGAVFVPLAEVQDPAQVADALARDLGEPERPGQPAAQAVLDYLGLRSALVVLDNFEHVLDAASLVARLLAHCPGVRVLVTSRAPLQIAGEHRYPVPPLAVPDGDGAALLHLDAVTIFEQRAKAVVPDFAVTELNAVTVAAICRRLDGLPLAIELAAPWLRVLSSQDLLDRLEQRLGLLEAGRRDQPERHRTLRAALRWSYDLLPPRQQRVFRSLAVFVGGCTEEAAAAVAGASLTDLAALSDASLVVSEPPRFRMLETVRDFAGELLAGSAASAEVEQAHRDYFYELARRAELIGPDELVWKQRLEPDDANLQAAIGAVIESGDAERAIAFARELWRFWSGSGRLAEGSGWMSAVVELVDRAEPPPAPLLRAELLLWAGTVSRLGGDYGVAQDRYRAALELGPEIAGLETLNAAAHNLGIVAYELGDFDEAARLYEQTLGTARRLESGFGVAFTLVTIGDVERARGNPATAVAAYEEGLGLFRQMGYTSGIVQALNGLGGTAWMRGHGAPALDLYRQSLAENSGDPALVAEAFEGVAQVLAAQPDRAVRLLAVADTLREQGSVPRSPRAGAGNERLLAALRAALGEPAFTDAWDDGTWMTPEQARAGLLDGSAWRST